MAFDRRGRSGPGVIRSRKGETIVEAAVVLPVTILAVVTLIWLLGALLTQMAGNVQIHLALRQAQGEDAGTVRVYTHIVDSVTLEKTGTPVLGRHVGEKAVFLKRGGLTRGRGARDLRGSAYRVDEKKMIRYADLFREVSGTAAPQTEGDPG